VEILAKRLAKEDLVVALDGPAASGKSSAGRNLAAKLDYFHINSGAMYRAAAWKMSEDGILGKPPETLVRAVEQMSISCAPTGNCGSLQVCVDGIDVTDLIGSADIGDAASVISAIPGLRRHLVRLQQETGRLGRVVMDGRDIGTVVFPWTEYKFYIDAELPVRAKRRLAELQERGEIVDFDEVQRQLAKRDHNDSIREDSPLVRAVDATYLDTSRLNPTQVVEQLLQLIFEKRFGS